LAKKFSGFERRCHDLQGRVLQADPLAAEVVQESSAAATFASAGTEAVAFPAKKMIRLVAWIKLEPIL
jgi:hypothetical protein